MKKMLLLMLAALFVYAAGTAQPVTTVLDSVVSAYSVHHSFNGSVLVASKGKILLQKGYGYKNAASKSANDAHTIFQIGSITKQFTAAIILKLQEQGKLQVNDKLSTYYPEVSWAGKVTIEHLLTHTSGIYSYTNDTAFMAHEAVKPANEKSILAMFVNKPLEFEPGTKWRYSNSGYMLLGYIIEKVTGKPYERVAREMIFNPLGMRNTGFDFKALQSPDKATGYDALTDKKVVLAGIVDSSVSYAAGAIYTTVGDLYLWDRALYTQKILQPASLQKAYTPYQKFRYGYGWGTDSLFGKKAVQHGGGIFGFTTYILRLPDTETVVILFDNTGSNGLGAMAKNLAAIVEGKPYQLPVFRNELQLDAAVLQPYTGVYELTPNLLITVTLEDGQLMAQATGQNKFELYAEKENYFFLKVTDAQMEFLKGTDGKVEKMILHQGGMDMPGKKIK